MRHTVCALCIAAGLLLAGPAGADDSRTNQRLSLQIVGRVTEMMDALEDMLARARISNPKTDQTYEMTLCQKVDADFDLRSLVVVEKPPALAGMTFLFHSVQGQEPAQWIFVPKTMRVRQIAGMDKTSFLGLDIQFEDFQFLQLAKLDDAVFRFLPPRIVRGKRCAVIEKTYGTDARFPKKVLYIGEDDLFPVQIESFDEKDRLRLTASFQSISSVQNIPTPLRIEIRDHDKEQDIVIEILEIRYNIGVRDDFFHLNDLRTVVSRMASLWKKPRASTNGPQTSLPTPP